MSESGKQPLNRAEQASILVLGKLAAMIIEGLTPFLIVRLLGKADVGAISGLILIYTTMAVVLGGGLPRSVLYYLSGRTLDQRWAVVLRLIKATFVLSVLTGVILLSVGVWGERALEAMGRWFVSLTGGTDGQEGERMDLVYLQLFALYPLLDMPVRLLPHILVGELRPRAAAGFNAFRSFGMSFGQLLPAALGWGLWGIVGGLLTFGVVNLLVFVWLLRGQYRAATTVVIDQSAWEMVRFSFPLGLTDVVGRLNSYLDRYLILFLMTSAAFAEYVQGAWQIPLITTVAYSVGDVYMSRFVELFKAGKPEEAIAIWRTSIQKVSLIVVPVATVFIVGAEEFITVAFTADYIAAAPVFRLYCCLLLLRVTSYGGVIVAAGKPQYVLRAAAWTLGSNAALSIPLVLWLGFVGPALGTALAFIPTVFIYCVYIARATGLRLSQTFPVFAWGKVVLVAAVPAALALWPKLTLEVSPLSAFLVQAAVVIVGFGVLGTLTGQIKRDDWRFLYRWVRLKTL